MRLDNTNQGELAALVQRVKKLEAAAPLGFSSITRGSLRVASAEGLIVDGSARVSGTLSVTGSENVSGTLNVTGTLNADGTVTLDGAVSVTGPLTVTGVTALNGNTTQNGALTAKGATRFEGDTTQVGAHHVQGNQDITGTLAVKGAATLENDLTVAGTGKILVGSMAISTQAGGYGQLASPTNIYLSAPFVVAAGVFTAIGNVNVGGALANSGMLVKSGATPNVHIDTAGKLWRTS